jgi:hypothetical protein
MGTAAAKMKFRVNPTVHVYVSNQFVVERAVHAPQKKDKGFVEFITDAPCTVKVDSDELFGANSVDLDPGPNLVEVVYDNPQGENSRTFTYDVVARIIKGSRTKKSKKRMKSMGTDPKDIIVP